MTLSELATFITTKVRQTDDNAVAACKTFLTRRAEMMWNEQMWKDSVMETVCTLESDGTSSLAGSIWLPSRATLLLPVDMDRILAVRSNEREIPNEPLTSYFRQSEDTLANTGTACRFHLLPPVVHEFEEASDLFIYPTATETAALRLTTSEDGTTKDKASASLAAHSSLADVLVLFGLSKPVTIGDVRVATAYENLVVSGAGQTDANGVYERTTATRYDHETEEYYILIDGSAATLFSDSDGEQYSIAENFPFGTWTVVGGGVEPSPTVAWANDNELISFPLADTFRPLHQRIRLVEIPSGDVTLRILFKAKFPGFDDDNDTCPIQGAENALIAFVSGDMLQRERQYAKAQLMQAEGQALLGQLKGVEVHQQSQRVRFIPEDGYASDFADWDGTFGKPELSAAVLPSPWRMLNGQLQFLSSDGYWYNVGLITDQGVATFEVGQEGFV